MSGHRDGRVGDPSALVQALARRFRMLTHLAPDDAHLARVRRLAGRGHPASARSGTAGEWARSAARVDGVDRSAYLLGDAGASDVAAPAVLVLLPA